MNKQYYFFIYFLLLSFIIKGSIGLSYYGTSKDKYYQVEYFNNIECSGDPIQYQAILIGTEHCFALPRFQVDCTGGFENNTSECFYSFQCFCGESCRNYVNLNQCVQDLEYNASFRIVYHIVNYLEKDFCVLSESFSLKEIPNEQIVKNRLEAVQVFKKGICLFGGNVDCDRNEIGFYNCNSTSISTELVKSLTNNAISNTIPLPEVIGLHYFFPGDPNFLTKSVKNNAFKSIDNNSLKFSITFILIMFLYL
ncbi:hypothetical protein RB653_000489 [Dictyostelium firmibasis]|uniref:Transmembrane protein n=1 Tax=Dictyostelium firmibasis TaxID=79012 RepID=A0AAN7YUD7_9MYCE